MRFMKLAIVSVFIELILKSIYISIYIYILKSPTILQGFLLIFIFCKVICIFSKLLSYTPIINSICHDD